MHSRHASAISGMHLYHPIYLRVGESPRQEGADHRQHHKENGQLAYSLSRQRNHLEDRVRWYQAAWFKWGR